MFDLKGVCYCPFKGGGTAHPNIFQMWGSGTVEGQLSRCSLSLLQRGQGGDRGQGVSGCSWNRKRACHKHNPERD